MPEFRVISFEIRIARNGGFIEGQTAGGGPFKMGPLRYEVTAAMAAVLNGYNPRYDNQKGEFVCGNGGQIASN